MGVDLVLVARTDALSATFIDNNIDPLDQPFILGCVDPNNKEKLLTFPEAGRVSIMEIYRGEERDNMMKMWNNVCYSISLKEALKIAKDNKFEFYFDWDTCRTNEGYYQVEGSVTYCIKRALAFSDYSDLIWMETATPDLKEAKDFADGVHQIKPHVMLGYNLSPSFNWDAQKMSDEEIENFIPNLATMGYVWQFITLAGFHMDALISEVFTKNFAMSGMLGFVEYI